MNKSHVFEPFNIENISTAEVEENFVEDIFCEVDKVDFCPDLPKKCEDLDSNVKNIAVVEEIPGIMDQGSEIKSAEFNKGYELGRKEAAEAFRDELVKKEIEIQQQISDQRIVLLENIKKSIQDLCASKKGDLEQKKQSLFNLSIQIGEKLATQSLNNNAIAVIEKFLAEIFENLQNDGVIHIKLNSEVHKEVEEIIKNWDLPNKIVVEIDNAIAKSDCIVTWQDGSAESILQSRFEDLRILLSSYTNG